MLKSVERALFGLKRVGHTLNASFEAGWGWLEDAINTFENTMIDLGDKTLLEFFVKYEKKSCRSFLVPKSAEKGLFWF